MVSSFDFPLRLRATGWPIGLQPNSIPRIFRDNLYPSPPLSSRRRTNDVDFQVSLRRHATVFSGGGKILSTRAISFHFVILLRRRFSSHRENSKDPFDILKHSNSNEERSIRKRSIKLD